MKNYASLLLAFLALSFSILTAIGSDQNLPEPDNIGTFYYFDSATNSLVPLEKKIAVTGREGWPKQKIVVKIDGEKALLRLKLNQKMVFVVSLANGVDPNKYQLVSFQSKGGKRKAVLIEGTWIGQKANPVFLPCNIGKFGDSYKFTPAQPLPVGEYAFSANDSNDAFGFGVDAGEDDGKK
jgi:hypothetical protein